jgi:hypothetical protein
MAKYRIISNPIPNQENPYSQYTKLWKLEEEHLNISHGLLPWFQHKIMPTETHILKSRIGHAFLRMWKIRGRRKEFCLYLSNEDYEGNIF